MTKSTDLKWEDEKYYYATDSLDILLNEAIRTKKVSAMTSIVLSCIKCNILMIDNVCILTAKDISENTGLYEKKIYKYLNELSSLNIIKKEKFKGNNAYYVNPKFIKHSNHIANTTLELFGISTNIKKKTKGKDGLISRVKEDRKRVMESF